MEQVATRREPPVDRAIRKILTPVLENEIALGAIQSTAKATHGVVTPSNLIDAYAFKKCVEGLDNLDTWSGIFKACGSLMADLIDGPIARVTDTSSSVGEGVDAVGDKIKLVYALKKIHELELAPNYLILGVLLQNGLNVGLTVADKMTNKNNSVIHASWAGKRAIFLQQWGLGLHVIGSRLEKDGNKRAHSVQKLGTFVTCAGLGMGGIATGGYTRAFIKSRRKD